MVLAFDDSEKEGSADRALLFMPMTCMDDGKRSVDPIYQS
jgi:hypothetical protein